MKQIIERLRSDDFDVKRETIIEISKIAELDEESLKELAMELEMIISKSDKSLSFFAKKAVKNLQKLEKLNSLNTRESSLSNEIKPLVDSLLDANKEVRINAISALKVYISEAFVEKALIEFAQSASEEEALMAIRTLEGDIIIEKDIQEEESISEPEDKIDDKIFSENNNYIAYKKEHSFPFRLIIMIVIIFLSLIFIGVKLDLIKLSSINQKIEKPKIDIDAMFKSYFSMIKNNKKKSVIDRFGKLPKSFSNIFGKHVKWYRLYKNERDVILIFKLENIKNIFVQKWSIKNGIWISYYGEVIEDKN